MIRTVGVALATALLGAGLAGAQAGPEPGRISPFGVIRASAMVDSVFLDRTRTEGLIDGGDWASYLLARLGAEPIPDRPAILVAVDTGGIEVRGRLQDLPLETRELLGPLAAVVDSSTEVVALVGLERTGREVARFWLRGLIVNGYRFPEFLLAPMMARVGRQYPALTRTGRDLYVQIPPDGGIALGTGGIRLSVVPPGADSLPPGRGTRQ